MKDSQPDGPLVAHDAFTLAFASVCGAVGAAIEQSLAIGMLMMGSTLALGVIVTRVGPFRRAVTRLALAALRAAESVASK